MAEVVGDVILPPTYWYTLESLSLGDWLAVPNFKCYSEGDALAEAQKLARENNTSYRVIFNQQNG